VQCDRWQVQKLIEVKGSEVWAEMEDKRDQGLELTDRWWRQ
jgi:hypothetical protein